MRWKLNGIWLCFISPLNHTGLFHFQVTVVVKFISDRLAKLSYFTMMFLRKSAEGDINVHEVLNEAPGNLLSCKILGMTKISAGGGMKTTLHYYYCHDLYSFPQNWYFLENSNTMMTLYELDNLGYKRQESHSKKNNAKKTYLDRNRSDGKRSWNRGFIRLVCSVVA